MDEDKNENKLSKSDRNIPAEIHFGHSSSLDLSWLSEDERKVLMMDYTKGMLDIKQKAQELQIDAAVLKKTLDDLSDTTRDVSESGNSVTISHTQTTKVGRTEVIMGNTEQAQTGKLSKSQTGETNWTPYYIFAVIIAIVLIAALSSG